MRRLIRLVHDNDGLVVANNLLSGPEMRVETDAKVEFRGNVTRVLSERFADAAAGDLHLRDAAPGVTDAGVALDDVPEDIDRQRRDARPDVGADEIAKN